MKEKSLITLKIRKRHIVILIVFLVAGLIAYSIYFREFMTLPQSAINVIPESTFDLKDKKVMVFSPHCDDETLGTFGVIDRTLASGGDVKVVMITDCNHRFNGNVRRGETASALAIAGLDKSKIDFLNFYEGRDVRSSADTVRLENIISQELDSFKPDLVFAPNVADTHLDHRFVATGVKKVLKERGESSKAIYYLIHYNFLKFPSPPGLKPNAYLTPPVRLINPSVRWYKFSLTDTEESLKEEAVFKYKTQLKITNPVLSRVLLDFVRENELFMTDND